MRPKLILLISIDTLRADHLGCYGYLRNTSPTIDLLAKESVMFRNAFTTCPYTLPAHASLFTGQYPSHHSVGFNQGSGQLNPDSDITLAEVLRGQGYQTGAFVSSFVLRKEINLNLGFDHYDDKMTSSEANRPAELLRPCTETNESLSAWLQQHQKDEMFIFLHYFDAHGPYVNPPEYRGLFVRDRWYGEEKLLSIVSDGQPGGIPAYQVLNAVRDRNGDLIKYEQDLHYYIAEYDAGIRYCDDAIREVLNELRRLGLYDDALIIITSDHGEAFGENNVYFFHGLTLTPDQIHVPMLIKLYRDWNLEPRTIKTPMSLVDLFPTICELVGFDCSALEMDGKSLVKPMEKGDDREFDKRTIISEIEGQIARIDSNRIIIEPKTVSKEKLVFFYVEELCRKSKVFLTDSLAEVDAMKFTWERYLPDLDSPEISYEHWHRYLYATQFVKDKVVLDIACGEGYGSYLISQQAKTVVGVDISHRAINYATIKYVKDNLEFKIGSVRDIPIDGAALFDVVVSFETIEHLTEDEQESFLKEVKRLLKPDGLFIVSTPNKIVHSDIPNYKNEFHIKEFYINEFREFLGKYFKNLNLLGQKIYPVSYIWNPSMGKSKLVEYRLEYSEKGFRPTDEPKNMLYAIALCSNSDINSPESSVLIDISERILRLKNQHITSLQAALKEKEAYIQQLQSFADKVKNTIFYKIYQKAFKPFKS